MCLSGTLERGLLPATPDPSGVINGGPEGDHCAAPEPNYGSKRSDARHDVHRSLYLRHFGERDCERRHDSIARKVHVLSTLSSFWRGLLLIPEGGYRRLPPATGDRTRKGSTPLSEN